MNVKAKVDIYIEKQNKWSDGLQKIRAILLSTELDEEIKWGMPTYCLNGKNVLSYSGFKNHFGIWFHQGVFLSDKLCKLENAQEGKTKGMRHLKYTDNNDVDIKIVKAYILEAIQNQKEGKEIKPSKKSRAVNIPELLKSQLTDKGLNHLQSFSNSKRNEYKEYITSAKKESTKQRRLEKICPMIEKGIGLNDQYKRK